MLTDSQQAWANHGKGFRAVQPCSHVNRIGECRLVGNFWLRPAQCAGHHPGLIRTALNGLPVAPARGRRCVSYERNGTVVTQHGAQASGGYLAFNARWCGDIGLISRPSLRSPRIAVMAILGMPKIAASGRSRAAVRRQPRHGAQAPGRYLSTVDR